VVPTKRTRLETKFTRAVKVLQPKPFVKVSAGPEKIQAQEKIVPVLQQIVQHFVRAAF
jgi:hypothetical protein